jgi:hypothetical protein
MTVQKGNFITGKLPKYYLLLNRRMPRQPWATDEVQKKITEITFFLWPPRFFPKALLTRTHTRARYLFI